MTSAIVINGAFRGQRTTGQQRYAQEMTQAMMLNGDLAVRERSLPSWLRKSKLGAWAWAQTLGLPRRANQYLFTATSRGPLLAHRHVLVVHDLFVFTHPEWYTTRYALSHRLVLRTQLKSATLIVAVSEPVAEEVRQQLGQDKLVVVAPNAPSKAFLQERPEEERELVLSRFGLRDGSFFLAVAGDDPRKNLASLRMAFKNAEMASTLDRLVVVGAKSSHVFASSQRGPDLDELQLRNVSDDELAALYQSSRAVLIPSLDEGFSLPAVEALAGGARVIASDIPVHRWVCGEDATYVPPMDIDAWTRAILAAATAGPVEASQRRAPTSLRHRFSWEQSARKVVNAVKDLDQERD